MAYHEIIHTCAFYSEGFMLADAGYDVWLGNFRGNRYSMQHHPLDPEEMEYWDFWYNDNILFISQHIFDYVLYKIFYISLIQIFSFQLG